MICYVLAAVAVLAVFASPAAAREPLRLYVATDGNDAWSGRLPAPNRTRTDGPFSTLQRARDAARAQRNGAGVVVTIRGGVYRVADTLTLTREDAGRPDAAVVWQATPRETVRLLGGPMLRDFRPVADGAVLSRLDPAAAQHVVQIDLRAAGVTDLGWPTPSAPAPLTPAGITDTDKPQPPSGGLAQLVCNGRYMPLARYPNEGEWVRVSGIPEGGTKTVTESDSHYGRFTYEGDRPSRWANTSDLWVHGYWVWDWSDQYHHVQRLDLAKHEIWPEPPYHGYGYRKGQRFYFLNVLEELDSPGEWYLDRGTGILYFWPPSDIRTAEVYFPVLRKPMIVLDGARHVQVRGLTLECSRDAAIVVRGGEHNEIAGCTVRNMGADSAITVSGSDSGVRSSDIYEIAGTGITVEGGDRKTLTAGRNYVVNCDIHDIARVFRTYHGAVNLSGVGHRIAHCSIHDLPHQGIGYSGNDHAIEYCDFTRIAQETGDVGVTYTAADWTFMGHAFRNNYFHNIHGPGHLGCFTIYPDLPCGGIHLHHNVFFDVDQGFYTNSGRGMLIENNVFLQCGRSIGFGTWRVDSMFLPGGAWKMVENLEAVRYDQPPYSTRYPALRQLAADFALGPAHVLERERPKDNLIRRNVSWGGVFLHMWPLAGLEHVKLEGNAIADDVVFEGAIDGGSKSATYRNGDATIASELGKRGNVIVRGDPGLGDLRTQDFRVRAASAARSIGFEAIPFRKIGLYRDAYRRTLPATVGEPVIVPAAREFTSDLTVRILPTPQPRGPRCTVRYTLDGSEPTAASVVYTAPLLLTETTTVKAAGFASPGGKELRSVVVSATFRRGAATGK